MNIDISQLEEVSPAKGSRKKPVFLVSRGGYFSMNSAFKKQNDIDNPGSVSLKASRKDEKLVVALRFFRGDEGNFKVTHTLRGSSWFSGRSLFSQFGISHESLAPKRRSLRLKATVQNVEGIKYIITEIPLPRK